MKMLYASQSSQRTLQRYSVGPCLSKQGTSKWQVDVVASWIEVMSNVALYCYAITPYILQSSGLNLMVQPHRSTGLAFERCFPMQLSWVGKVCRQLWTVVDSVYFFVCSLYVLYSPCLVLPFSFLFFVFCSRFMFHFHGRLWDQPCGRRGGLAALFQIDTMMRMMMIIIYCI